MEEAEKEGAVWDEDGRMEVLVTLTGVPSPAGGTDDSGLLLVLEEAASV